MRRWAWRILVAASAVMFVATVVLWMRAQWAHDYVSVQWLAAAGRVSEQRGVSLATYRGSAEVMTTWTSLATVRPGEREHLATTMAAEPFGRHVAGPPERFPYDWMPADAVRLRWRAGGFGIERFDTTYLDDAGVDATAYAGTAFDVNGARRIGGQWYAAVADRHTRVAVPWWFVTLLFALAPARALWTWRRRRGRPSNACQACGYDLRATPDAAGPRLSTCPECGRASRA